MPLTTHAFPKDRSTSFCFLALPPELRVCIYEHYFGARKNYLLLVNENAVGGRWCKDNYKADIALLYTCREVYAEASPILFSTTRFVVDISPDMEPDDLMLTCKSLGTLDQCIFVNHIQHVSLSIWAVQDAEITAPLTTAFLQAVNDCHFVNDVRLDLWSTVPEETARAMVETLMKIDCRGQVGVHLKADKARGISESLLQTLRR
ncbi:hypothetical protein LTR37_017054 [Vermiconidia calcicola]|uniref:Uncharacterized protein n=1 Tax=Vermiconidia calcicola TaxID=1690605 RepID=A0ACC3MLA1_9PEZI|nr:hypothetical protein LTR37_017054 [Vermiconidia calcicola]